MDQPIIRKASVLDGLIQRLPEEGTEFALINRLRWLRAMAAAFDVCYSMQTTDVGKEITVHVYEGDTGQITVPPAIPWN